MHVGLEKFLPPVFYPFSSLLSALSSFFSAEKRQKTDYSQVLEADIRGGPFGMWNDDSRVDTDWMECCV